MAPRSRFVSGGLWRAVRPSVHWDLRSKRNETGVFRAVTGKASRLAPPNTPVARKDPFNIQGLCVSRRLVENSFFVQPGCERHAPTKTTAFSHSSCDHIGFVASQPATVSPSDVSRKNVSRVRQGLTYMASTSATNTEKMNGAAPNQTLVPAAENGTIEPSAAVALGAVFRGCSRPVKPQSGRDPRRRSTFAAPAGRAESYRSAHWQRR